MTERARGLAGQEKWQTPGSLIRAKFFSHVTVGTPLYLRVQNSIGDLIDGGQLSPGVQLPPEQWLSRELGVALGTIQKALRTLDSDGRIVRRHGHGTYVAKPRKAMEELWHLRFFKPGTDQMLNVYSNLLDRRLIERDSAVSGIIGEDPSGYVEIQRLIDVSGHVYCHSSIWLKASVFGPLLEFDETYFQNVNLKSLLGKDFGLTTRSTKEHGMLVNASASIAKAINIPPDTTVLRLRIVGLSGDNEPFLLQHIYIPPSGLCIDFTFGANTA